MSKEKFLFFFAVSLIGLGAAIVLLTHQSSLGRLVGGGAIIGGLFLFYSQRAKSSSNFEQSFQGLSHEGRVKGDLGLIVGAILIGIFGLLLGALFLLGAFGYYGSGAIVVMVAIVASVASLLAYGVYFFFIRRRSS